MFQLRLFLLTLLSLWPKHTQPRNIELSIIVILLDRAAMGSPRHNHKILLRYMRSVFGVVLRLDVLKIVWNHIDFGLTSRYESSAQIHLTLVILDLLQTNMVLMLAFYCFWN